MIGAAATSAAVNCATDGWKWRLSSESSQSEECSAPAWRGSRFEGSYAAAASAAPAAAAAFAAFAAFAALAFAAAPSAPASGSSAAALAMASRRAGTAFATSESSSRQPHANDGGACAQAPRSRFAKARARAGAAPSSRIAL